MPLGENEACVISFDVIESSKVKHERFSEILEEFMSEVREMMMEEYDETTLTSNGYMIKEMGDGFLCSVGYPFKQVGGLQSECALQLAERMVQKFSKLVSTIESRKPIYCSAGIASGKVRSYFSKSGRIRDDLWGDAIVLATRYEGMRKQLFDLDRVKPGNIIIIQEAVYDSLNEKDRSEFETLTIADSNLKVRDDPQASQIAFKKL